jgi:hypothetical protein
LKSGLTQKPYPRITKMLGSNTFRNITISFQAQNSRYGSR